MTSEAAISDPIMATYRRWDVDIASGRGATLTTEDGRQLIDLLGGIAVCATGHCHPRVTQAIRDQAEKLVHVSNLYRSRPQRDLAHRLSELSGGSVAYFANSGAEAIECALKLARKKATLTGKRKPVIVATEGGFHGRTFGALAATGQPHKQEPFAPMLAGFVHVPYGDSTALTAALTDDVVAVLVEPIQGEAGVVVPPEGYLADVRAACDRADALLILDEIQTGLGRTGAWFAYESSGIQPDVVCLAKALGGGLPIGVCLARPEVASLLEPGDHGSTFGGGPVQCAAALSVLDVIESEDLIDRARVFGSILMHRLQVIFDGASIRGRGMLIGIELPSPLAHEVAASALEHGVLVNDATPSVIRLAPPLVITEPELEAGLRGLEAAWAQVTSEVGGS
ncbi:MAG TPA: acetylornithine transaminase [Actinomycetota bacterium]|nr:acetylornithine transaminase [Actinomycetota bacterium]